MLFLYGLSQDIDYSFLYCAVPSWCLSILYVTVYIFSPQTPTPCLPTLPPLGTHKSVLRLWACFSFVDKSTCSTFEISGVRDIVWNLRFCVWLTSLSMTLSSSTHLSCPFPLFVLQDAEYGSLCYRVGPFFF